MRNLSFRAECLHAYVYNIGEEPPRAKGYGRRGGGVRTRGGASSSRNIRNNEEWSYFLFYFSQFSVCFLFSLSIVALGTMLSSSVGEETFVFNFLVSQLWVCVISLSISIKKISCHIDFNWAIIFVVIRTSILFLNHNKNFFRRISSVHSKSI